MNPNATKLDVVWLLLRGVKLALFLDIFSPRTYFLQFSVTVTFYPHWSSYLPVLLMFELSQSALLVLLQTLGSITISVACSKTILHKGNGISIRDYKFTGTNDTKLMLSQSRA